MVLAFQRWKLVCNGRHIFRSPVKKTLGDKRMEYLIDRILLRPLPLATELEDTDVVRIADLLGISPTLDEMEDNRLDDLPLRVQAELERLQPLQLIGYVHGSTDARDRLLRILNHHQVFVRSFTIAGSHITVDGYHTPEVHDYVVINASEIITGTSQPTPVGAVTVAWSRSSQPITLLCENLELAGRLADPLWRGRYHVQVLPRTIKFILEAIQATPAELHSYLEQHHEWHSVHEFTTVSEANVEFVVPYIASKLPQLRITLRVTPANAEHTVYVIQYHSSTLATRSQEVYDPLIRQELLRLLSPSGFLRYYAVTTNPLEQVFMTLEDLQPAVDSYLVAPSDRGLQQHYARVQDYSEAEAFRQVLLRREEFLTTRQITHQLRQRCPTANRAGVLHVLGRYWSLLHDPPSLTLQNDMLIIRSTILSLADALGLYILMLQAQQQAQRPLHRYFRWLRTIECGQLPSELITYLEQAPTSDAYEVAPCSLLPNCTSLSCPIPSASCKLPPTRYYVLQVPYHRYSSTALQQKGDTVELRYWRDGIEEHVLSLYSEEIYHVSDFQEQACSAEVVKYIPVTTVVNSQDYKLDITAIGDYYRLDVVAIPNDKPVDRWTILYLPLWLEIHYPTILETLVWQWNRGKFLSPCAKKWYRLTRSLWGSTSIATQYANLTPKYWQGLTTDQIIQQVQRLFL